MLNNRRSCPGHVVTYGWRIALLRVVLRNESELGTILSYPGKICVAFALQKSGRSFSKGHQPFCYIQGENTMRWTGVPFRVRLRPMPSVVPCFPVRSASTRATSRECIRKPSTGNELTETWQGINTNNELITVLSLCLFTDGLFALLSLTFSLSFYVTVTSGY